MAALFIISTVIGFIGGISYFISRRVYRGLSKKGFRSPMAVSVVIFVLSFVSIIATVCFVFILNFQFER